MLVDYSSGFGGKFGVQKDRQDQSALGYEHQEKVEKHASQKGWFLTLIRNGCTDVGRGLLLPYIYLKEPSEAPVILSHRITL